MPLEGAGFNWRFNLKKASAPISWLGWPKSRACPGLDSMPFHSRLKQAVPGDFRSGRAWSGSLGFARVIASAIWPARYGQRDMAGAIFGQESEPFVQRAIGLLKRRLLGTGQVALEEAKAFRSRSLEALDF